MSRRSPAASNRIAHAWPFLRVTSWRSSQANWAVTTTTTPTTSKTRQDGRAAFQSVFHIHLHVVPRQNGDKLSFAKGMLLRRDPDREKTGRTLREALEKIDATE